MQTITPLEIRQKSFDKSFRGYHKEEVDAFLSSLAHTWEKVLTQLQEADAKYQNSHQEVKRLQDVENALLKTVKDAEITAHNIVDQAQREAALKTKEAELAATSLLNEAKEQAKALQAESQRQLQHQQQQGQVSLEKVKANIREAEAYRETLLQKLQHLAEDMLTRSQLIKNSIEQRALDQEAPDAAATTIATDEETTAPA